MKRILDIVLSLAALVLLAPLLLIIALLIKLDDGGPVLFKSQRIGRNGQPFTLLKFRSMYVNSPPRYGDDGKMIVEANDPRVTRIGRILRLGFDELPQLLNVLKGEMSLVGPRPDPPAALALYHPGDHRRLTVRPGITGLAQINGRTELSLQKRIAYDLLYVENCSSTLDIKIIFWTATEFIPPLKKRRPDPVALPAAYGGHVGTSSLDR